MNDFKEYSAAFQDHQNSLMHYGVKGMKWDPSKKHGTRKTPNDLLMEKLKNQSTDHRTDIRGALSSYADYKKNPDSHYRFFKDYDDRSLDSHIKDHARQRSWNSGGANAGGLLIAEKMIREHEKQEEKKKEKRRKSLTGKALRQAKIRNNKKKAEEAYRRGGN